jgi:multicomponent Na+:H+ antiporter subunit B
VAPLLLLFSVFMFVRGHNEPGGGFSGGLIAAAAMSVWVMADGVAPVRRVLRVSPHTLIAAGLLVALASGVAGPLRGEAFMTGVWIEIATPLGAAKLGTPLLFDLGVYLTVAGSVLAILFTLSEELDE